MKVLAQVLALFAVMGLATVAYAAKANKSDKAPKQLRGEIVKVDKGSIVVKTTGKQAKEVTVTTDDNTKVTVEGKDSKLGELKAGQKVVVTPATGTATKIAVPKPKAAKQPKAKA